MTARLLSLVLLVLGCTGVTRGSSTLIFPRLSFGPEDLTGIAIVNPGEATATVTFTAWGVNGSLLSE